MLGTLCDFILLNSVLQETSGDSEQSFIRRSGDVQLNCRPVKIKNIN